MSDLARIYTVDGPFATAYLDISRDTEDAAKAIELRWRDGRRELAAHGVDEATLAAMDQVVGEGGDPGPAGQGAAAGAPGPRPARGGAGPAGGWAWTAPCRSRRPASGPPSHRCRRSGRYSP